LFAIAGRLLSFKVRRRLRPKRVARRAQVQAVAAAYTCLKIS